MTPYILHYAPDNASLIIRLVLEEMGLPYETRLVDRSIREQDSATYRALNPAGLIPALETPDGPIFETGAILLWLADKHDMMAPAPASPQRARFLKWLFYTANTIHPALRMTFYPEKYITPEAERTLRHSLQEVLSRQLGVLEEAAEVAWPTGADPTVLAYYIACILRWTALYPAGETTWFDLATYPALQKLVSGLEIRPATLAAQQAEGLGPTPFTVPHDCNPPEGSAL
jgi:glutathione S-transferase